MWYTTCSVGFCGYRQINLSFLGYALQVRWKTTYLLHHGIHNYPAFGREYYDRQQKAFLSIKNVHIDVRVERIKIPQILMTITFFENTALIFVLHLHFK